MASQKILVVAAHPDDEVLGCGGALAKHARGGDQVKGLILAEGVTSRDSSRDRKARDSELSALAKSVNQAAKTLGVSSVRLHDFPDNRMDSVDFLEIVKVIEEEVQRYDPDVIYTHHGGDLNIDHQLIQQAVLTASRPLSGLTHRTILFFEVPSSTEWQASSVYPFVPNWFVDISTTLSIKKEALEHYESEMRPWPHARSIAAVEHLARWRGASVGVEAAEAFMLGRRLT